MQENPKDNSPYQGNFLPPGNIPPEGGDDSAHIQNPKDLPFFDNTSGVSPEERKMLSEAEKAEKKKGLNKTKKKAKKSAKQIKKYNGVFALPVYLAAYRCLMECRFRFRNVPQSCRYVARDIEGRLLEIMADISMVYWNIQPYSSLINTYKNVLRTEVQIRSMRDSRTISARDFGCICQYTAAMVTNMVKWSNRYNPDHQQINALSGLDIINAQYEIPRVEVKEEDRLAAGGQDNETPVEVQREEAEGLS